HGWKREEVDTDFELVSFRTDPRRGDRDSSALRAEGGNELPHMHGRPFVSEHRHAWIGAHVEQTHQAAVHCLARVRTRSTLFGISPAPASAACTAGRLACRSNRSCTRRRAPWPSRARSSPPVSNRSSAAARPRASPGSTRSPHSPSTTASRTELRVVLTTGSPFAIASTITLGTPSRSPFGSTLQGRANMLARPYSFTT